MLANFTGKLESGRPLRKLTKYVGKLDFTQKGDAELTMGLITHLCDVSNCAKPFGIYYKWLELLFVEFFIQGDLKKSLGLPPSMLCDRETTNIAKAQIGFIDFFIKPPLVALSNVIDGMDVFLNQLSNNKV